LRKIRCPNIVIFTDLDGALLSTQDYSWKEAEQSLELCRKLGISVVLISSKTRAEIEVIRDEMEINTPFVSENGGAIFVEKYDKPLEGAKFDGKYFRLELGVPYNVLVKALKELKEELGWNIKGFSDMSVEEIAYLTGLDLSSAYLASLREYDEPFLILDEVRDISPLVKLAEDRGLRVFKGGRFYHIQGNNDKGKAVQVLKSWYKKAKGDIITVAIGDSPNDFPMFTEVEYPVLILSGREYRLNIPNLKVSRFQGPKGWNEEVLSIIEKLCS
jgi:mannosyl-3-phosphoglycerate phosphatase